MITKSLPVGYRIRTNNFNKIWIIHSIQSINTLQKELLREKKTYPYAIVQERMAQNDTNSLEDRVHGRTKKNTKKKQQYIQAACKRCHFHNVGNIFACIIFFLNPKSNLQRHFHAATFFTKVISVSKYNTLHLHLHQFHKKKNRYKMAPTDDGKARTITTITKYNKQ